MERKKLDLVIQAIAEARELTPRGQEVRVYISADNGLDAIYPQVLRDTLLKLQNDEGIIKIRSFPNWLLPSKRLTEKIFEERIKAVLEPLRKNFAIETLNGFDKWCADYWEKKKQTSGETLPPLMPRRKASWVETNVPWDVKKVIWQLWAKGETLTATQRFFELHQGEYEGAVFDRKTITKVRAELSRLPNGLVETLVTELPEVENLVKEERAKGRLA